MSLLWCITSPYDFSSEYDDIEQMFDRGLDYLILNKKDKSVEEYDKWLLGLPFELREKIWLRATSKAEKNLQVGGFIFEKKEETEIKELPNRSALVLHQLEDIKAIDTLSTQYVFAGPLNHSLLSLETKTIFKEKDLEKLSKMCSIPIIVYGGIDIDNLDVIKKYGISGCAIMSGIWNYADPINAFIKIKKKLTIL